VPRSRSSTTSQPAGPSAGRSVCPIAGTLDVVGDKWTLLILRDIAFAGKHRYGEFADSPEAIPTNILADRLRKMTAHGLIEARPYQDNPPRYEYHLTRRGYALLPVLRAIVKWGAEHIEGSFRPNPRQMRAAAARARRQIESRPG